MTESEFEAHHRGRGVEGTLTSMRSNHRDIPLHQVIAVASFFYSFKTSRCWGSYRISKTFLPRLKKLGMEEDTLGIIIHFNKQFRTKAPITYKGDFLRFPKIPIQYFF